MGKTGYKVSEIGFGAWQIGAQFWGSQSDEDSVNALHMAIKKGINFIDTASVYGDGKSEKIIGQFLKKINKRVYVATKAQPLPGRMPVSQYCLAEDRYPEHYLRKNIEERLKNLQTDKIDIFLLHLWTRAWNRNPTPLKILEKLKNEGKIENIGISTSEHDQNAAIDLMKNGLIDVVEVIYNIFEQEPAAEFLPTAEEYSVGVIGRVPFDEGALTGKYTCNTVFEKDDLRALYFAGERLKKTVSRVEKIKEDIKDTGLTMAQVALLFILNQSAISTVIPGMRNAAQVELNTAVSDMKPLPDEIIEKLKEHHWLRGVWYFD